MSSLDLRTLARALGGEVMGRNRVLAPGPSHSRQDRSLSIKVDPGAPDGFLVTSFAGDDPMACRDHVRALSGLPVWAPASGNRAAMPRPVIVATKPSEDEERKAAWLLARALEIWDEALDPHGTLVERYLNGRGLDLPDEAAGEAIRFQPTCPWKDENGRTIRVPAMIAAMRCIRTGTLRAVHRRRLTPDGHKVGKPKMLGPAAGAVIKLDPDDAVTTGLAVGEGVETCLAARQLGFRPVWALGSTGSIKTFPVLPGIEALTLLAENDENGANERAVEDCASRWDAAGREVIVAAPRVGKDMNDAIGRRAA